MSQSQSQTPYQIPLVSSNQAADNNEFLKQVQAEQEQQLQLQMLTQECQQLINKIFSSATIQVQQSFVSSDMPEQTNLKHDKSRLEKEFLDLCIEIQRQQKQLENYKFKIKVANKQAEYYSRQIKQKQKTSRGKHFQKEKLLQEVKPSQKMTPRQEMKVYVTVKMDTTNRQFIVFYHLQKKFQRQHGKKKVKINEYMSDFIAPQTYHIADNDWL